LTAHINLSVQKRTPAETGAQEEGRLRDGRDDERTLAPSTQHPMTRYRKIHEIHCLILPARVSANPNRIPLQPECNSRRFGDMAAPQLFNCPNCGAEYKLVRVEADPTTKIRELTCVKCGGPLHARVGRFVLKYFFRDGSRRRQILGPKGPSAQQNRMG